MHESPIQKFLGESLKDKLQHGRAVRGLSQRSRARRVVKFDPAIFVPFSIVDRTRTFSSH